MWLSMRPGIARLPCKSITWVSDPRRRMTSASRPTAAKRPPRIAAASASGFCRSMVVIRPLARMTSAFAFMA